jgi:uncharacterized protein YndB with AHSA1/START domain
MAASASKLSPGEVGRTVYSTPNETDLVAVRVLSAPRRMVFDAWTKPEHVTQWLLGPDGWTMPVCEIDLRAGGTWHWVWRKGSGKEMAMSGSYREVKPPERLVWTEKWGPEWPETVNTMVLTEKEGRTTCTITTSYPSKEAREAALQTGMKEGSERSFERLDAMLAELVRS